LIMKSINHLLALSMLLCTSTFVYAQTKPKTAIKQNSAVKTYLAATMLAGKTVYNKSCLSCHQADGAGVQRLNPPLIKTDYVLGDKKRLINIVLNGFSEEVEINGEYYDNSMPPLNFLNDQEIADVLTFVRNSFGNKATAVAAAEVSELRSVNKK
jgi:mono/diheme cytochrome c family protein